MLADSPAWLTQGGQHAAKDFTASVAGLIQGRADDLFADSVDFQIELDAGYTTTGASYLEVHVAVVVFVPHDVGQEHEPIGILDDTDRDAGHGIGNRHTGVHERQGAAADAGHAAGSV